MGYIEVIRWILRALFIPPPQTKLSELRTGFFGEIEGWYFSVSTQKRSERRFDMKMWVKGIGFLIFTDR